MRLMEFASLVYSQVLKEVGGKQEEGDAHESLSPEEGAARRSRKGPKV